MNALKQQNLENHMINKVLIPFNYGLGRGGRIIYFPLNVLTTILSLLIILMFHRMIHQTS